MIACPRVLRAQQVARTIPQLSVHDAFAFALAESQPGCMLLTGDSGLRAFAAQHKMEVHGVLWHRQHDGSGGP
jgi:hypothetical protein